MWIPLDVKHSKSDLGLRKIKVEILGWQTWLGWDILIWWLDEKEKRKKKFLIASQLKQLFSFFFFLFKRSLHFSEFRLRAPRLPRLISRTCLTHKYTQCLKVMVEIICLRALVAVELKSYIAILASPKHKNNHIAMELNLFFF